MAGCTFGAPGDPADDADAEAEPIDIPPAAEPAPRPCGSSETGVVLCIDFEDTSRADLAVDGSTHRNNALATGVRSIQRAAGEKAAELDQSSNLRVPASDMLDVQKFTIEMWIRPAAAPAKDKVAGLFDNPGQYAMLFEDKRRVRCGLTGDRSAHSEASVPMGMWSHVACRYDGNELRIYINGQLSECDTYGARVDLGGFPGAAIGSRLVVPGPIPLHGDRFIGGVDNVRVYDRALLDDQICTASGHLSGTCNATCPIHDDDDGGPGGPGGLGGH